MSLENICFRGDGGRALFPEVLEALKQEGCNLLVTGAVSGEVTDVATRRLLGAPFAERKRVVALADVALDRVDDRLPGGCRPTDSNVHVVARRNEARSAAASGSAPVEPTPTVDSVRTVGSDLRAFRGAICDAVVEYDEAAEGLDPAEFRLSLDSLRLLLDDHDRDAVARFLRAVTALVSGVNGMAHYHLPVDDDADVVASLAPLFDARIELRRREGVAPEQRWHVPEYDARTAWVRL